MTLSTTTLGAGGRPLVICHGLFGQANNWASVAKQLAEHRQVVLVDLRNHGASFHHDDLSYPLMAQDIAKLNLGEVDFLGHSMGGKVGMQLAHDYPDHIHKLIVVDIAPKAYGLNRHDRILSAMMALELSQFSSRQAIDEAMIDDLADRALRLFLLKNVKRHADGFYWQVNLDAIKTNYSHIAAAPQFAQLVTTPTLFIRGDESDYIQSADISTLDRWFAQYRLQTIDGAGHWVHAQQPDALIAMVEAFLSGTPT